MRRSKAATITVTAKDGVVLLDGVAPTAAAKQRAISIARDTDGVVQVIDRITVGRVNHDDTKVRRPSKVRA